MYRRLLAPGLRRPRRPARVRAAGTVVGRAVARATAAVRAGERAEEPAGRADLAAAR